MNGLNRMRLEAVAMYIDGAAAYRGFAGRTADPELRADFIARARKYLRYARQDLVFARRAGWKLPG